MTRHGCIVRLSCIATVGDWECRQPLYRDGLCIDHDAQRAAGLTLSSVQPFEDAAQQPDTTQPVPECPPASIAPQTGAQGRNEWAAGYAAARRFYGDTAPIALDKIRARLDQFTTRYGWADTSPLGDLLRDLQAILDTTQEDHHD